MKCFFEKTLLPCIDNAVTRWHVAYGWIWNIVEIPSRRRIGVFYATLLCGDGVVVHFDVKYKVSPATTLYAMRHGIELVSGIFSDNGAVFAMIPAGKEKLIRVAGKLGFVPTSGEFFRDGKRVVLLILRHR